MPIIKKAPKRFSPARVLVLGFLGIIAAGTLLLFFPFSSKSGEFTDILDCLFTATSAACVTGLSVVDTYTHWTLVGQIVIALLVQVGGLGFVTIITYFNIAAGKKLGLRTLKNAASDVSENSFDDGKKVFGNILKYSAIFELMGAIVLCFQFVPEYDAYGIWMGIFMSIMAFCNAGFDLLGMRAENSSVITEQDNPVVLITLAILIILGGLGFIVWENFINYKTRKKLSLHTKTVLFMTAVLIIGGTVFFMLTESDNPDTLGKMPFGEKLLNSFFTSVSSRTAGFDSVGVANMSEFSRLGTAVLMFIGGAPGSTAGGIKVTTLMVMIVTVVSYIRNKNDVELFKHKLGKLTIYRTLVISVLSLLVVATGFIVVYFSTPAETERGAVQGMFDAVNAFSTTGFETGPASYSSVAGKLVLIFTMFIGRVGPVSLVMSLVLNSKKRKDIVMPDGQILIG